MHTVLTRERSANLKQIYTEPIAILLTIYRGPFFYLGEQVASLEVEDLGLVLEVGGSVVAPGSLGLFARLAPGVHSSSIHLVIHTQVSILRGRNSFDSNRTC